MNIHYTRHLEGSKRFRESLEKIRAAYQQKDKKISRGFYLAVILLARYFLIPKDDYDALIDRIVSGKWPSSCSPYSIIVLPLDKEKFRDIRLETERPFVLVKIDHDLTGGDWEKLKKDIKISIARAGYARLRPDTFVPKASITFDRALAIKKIKKSFRGGHATNQQLGGELIGLGIIDPNWDETDVNRELRRVKKIFQHS